MLAAICPWCGSEFAGEPSSNDDDEDANNLLTCPYCLRSFDPYAKKGPSATAGLDELFDLTEDDEGEEPED